MRGTKPDEQLERPHQGRLTLAMLRREAASCTACDLYKRATQTVFGEGSVSARMVLVGEQPGNDEDLAGRPFVGPAGRFLDEALERAGLDRRSVYITNAESTSSGRARRAAGAESTTSPARTRSRRAGHGSTRSSG